MKTGHSRKYPKRCGKKEHRLAPVRKGLLNRALDFWLVKNGYGLTPITKINSAIQYWPKRRAI